MTGLKGQIISAQGKLAPAGAALGLRHHHVTRPEGARGGGRLAPVISAPSGRMFFCCPTQGGARIRSLALG